MTSPSTQRQRGLTMISLLFVLAGIGFVVLVILKVLPLYMEHGKVVSILNNLKSEEGIELKPEPEVLTILKKRFAVDDVTNVTQDDVTITKTGHKLTVDIEYQAVAPLFSNVSVLLDYSDSIEIGHE